MIELKNFCKSYKKNIFAVEDLSIDIRDGEILGFLGHNGAGKSTIIKAIVGIHKATSGEILFKGEPFSGDSIDIKRHISYVPDNPDFFLQMQPMTYFNLIADVYGLDENTKKTRLDSLVETFQFEEYLYGIIEDFSHGTRQKVYVIASILVEPKLWVLDEPMTGLDPQSIYNLRELMNESVRKGNTVIMSTHDLNLAEQICTRIAILKKGKLKFLGTIDELKAKYQDNSLEEIYLQIAGSNTISDSSDLKKQV